VIRNKSSWCEKLNGLGIPVSPWWSGCHRGLDWSEYPEALALKAHVILLPVHQGLDTRQIEYIARSVRSLASAEEPLSCRHHGEAGETRSMAAH
jgi:dTDP-4-amino-4,6-dideoxygalactose transaminase